VGEKVVNPSDIEGLQILCIDDEERLLESMEVMLSGWGCHVFLARSIGEALGAIEIMNDIPDVIIADYHLGDGTGIEAVQLIYEETGNEIPTVIVTGDHSAETQRDIKWRGFAMLRKPIKPAALRSIMASVRSQREAAE